MCGQCSNRTDDNRHSRKPVAQCDEPLIAGRPVRKQPTAVRLGTGLLGADAHIVYAGRYGRKHVADFIHRPVGVGRQQQTRIGGFGTLKQELLHHGAEGHIGFPGTRRSDQQEKVLGLLGRKDDGVDGRI